MTCSRASAATNGRQGRWEAAWRRQTGVRCNRAGLAGANRQCKRWVRADPAPPATPGMRSSGVAGFGRWACVRIASARALRRVRRHGLALSFGFLFLFLFFLLGDFALALFEGVVGLCQEVLRQCGLQSAEERPSIRHGRVVDPRSGIGQGRQKKPQRLAAVSERIRVGARPKQGRLRGRPRQASPFIAGGSARPAAPFDPA